MDANAMFAFMASQPQFMEQFQQFMASRNSNTTQPQDGSSSIAQERGSTRDRSATAGRSSDSAKPPESMSQSGSKGRDSNRERSPTFGRTSDDVDESPRRGRSLTRRSPSPASEAEPSPDPPLRKGNPRRRDESPHTADPPAPTRAQSAARYASASRTSPHQNSSAHSPPRRNRSASISSQNPRNQSPSPRRRQRQPAPPERSTSPPAPKTSKRRKRPAPPAKTAEHEYDRCPTSYELRPGKRGGRVQVQDKDGKMVTRHTRIERLAERRDKHKYVKRNGHLFGDKHGCYFNPYSYSKVNEKNCKQIDKPAGFQIGRGGILIHELIGLRDDYDYFNDIRGSVRKGCLKWRPQNITLGPKEGLCWGHYSSAARKKIYDYVYSHHPFLFHFRDKTGEDSWAIKEMAQQYLTSARAYINSKSCERYLRRNASGPTSGSTRQQKENPDEVFYEDLEVQLKVPEQAPEGDDDDYTMNAKATSHEPSTSGAGPSHRNRSRSRSPEKTAHRGYDDEPRLKKRKQVVAPPSRSPSPFQRPTEPTARDIRLADKTVAIEDARNKDLGSSRDKVGASKPAAPKPAAPKSAAPKSAAPKPTAPKPTAPKSGAASKGKGKEREDASTASKSKTGWGNEEEEEEESDDEPVRQIIKNVAPKKNTRVESSPEVTPAPNKATKGSKRKTNEGPEIDEDEEPAPKKRTAKPKMRPVPPPEPEAMPTPGPSTVRAADNASQVANASGGSEASGAPTAAAEPQIVGMTKIKVKRPIPPSTRKLRGQQE